MDKVKKTFIKLLQEQGEKFSELIDFKYDYNIVIDGRRYLPEEYLSLVGRLLLETKEIPSNILEKVKEIVDTLKEYYLKYLGKLHYNFKNIDVIMKRILSRKRPYVEIGLWQDLYDNLKEVGEKDVGGLFGVKFPTEELNYEVIEYFKNASLIFKQNMLNDALTEYQKNVIATFISLILQGKKLIDFTQKDINWILEVLEEEKEEININKLVGFYSLIKNFEKRLRKLEKIKNNLEGMKQEFLDIVNTYIPLLMVDNEKIYTYKLLKVDNKILNTVKEAIDYIFKKFNNIINIKLNTYITPMDKILPYLLKEKQKKQEINYEKDEILSEEINLTDAIRPMIDFIKKTQNFISRLAIEKLNPIEGLIGKLNTILEKIPLTSEEKTYIENFIKDLKSDVKFYIPHWKWLVEFIDTAKNDFNVDFESLNRLDYIVEKSLQAKQLLNKFEELINNNSYAFTNSYHYCWFNNWFDEKFWDSYVQDEETGDFCRIEGYCHIVIEIEGMLRRYGVDIDLYNYMTEWGIWDWIRTYENTFAFTTLKNLVLSDLDFYVQLSTLKNLVLPNLELNTQLLSS